MSKIKVANNTSVIVGDKYNTDILRRSKPGTKQNMMDQKAVFERLVPNSWNARSSAFRSNYDRINWR